MSIKFKVILGLILLGLLVLFVGPINSPKRDDIVKNAISFSSITTSPEIAPRHEQVGNEDLTKLRRLLTEKVSDRSPLLMKILEPLLSQSLNHETLAVCREIFQQGDMEECAMLISLLEQREERDSVNLLVSQLQHRDQEISHRAWMTCEAKAGKIFKSNEEIVQWAADWEPNPRVRNLMEQNQPNEVLQPSIEHPSQRMRAEPYKGRNRFDLSK